MATGTYPTEHEEWPWLEKASLPEPRGHPFYERLNALLDTGGFADIAEQARAQFHAVGASLPSTPRDGYSHMNFICFCERV